MAVSSPTTNLFLKSSSSKSCLSIYPSQGIFRIKEKKKVLVKVKCVNSFWCAHSTLDDLQKDREKLFIISFVK